MSLQSAGGGDYSTLVINTLINRTQNIIYADNTPKTTFQGEVEIPSLKLSGSMTNAPNPLSFTGDVNINGVLGADKNMKGLIVGNRDFTKCDANGNGLPGENPNAGQVVNTIWGPSTFHTAVTVDRRLNPGDGFDVFGLGLEVKNPDQTPYPSAFGFPQSAKTSVAMGHDSTNAGAEFTQIFNYYGPGHFRNKVAMDSSDNIFSTTPALVITMPTRTLINSLSVLPGNFISTTGNVGTVRRINAFKDYSGAGTPVPGMTVTISAEPVELNVTNAIIISVTPLPGSQTGEYDLTYEFNVGGSYTSTKINYVHLGPGVSANGAFGQVIFPKGPHPLIGQKISILAQPTSLNITNAVINNVTYGTNYSTLYYNLTTPVTGQVDAVSITSVKLVPGTLGQNTNYGGQGNLGIHTLTPEASLDVTGDAIFREVTTGNPMFQTTTIPTPTFGTQCNLTMGNPFDVTQPSIFVDYDLTNQRISYKSRSTNSTMYQVDAVSGFQTYYNPDQTKVLDIACLQAPSAFTFYKMGGITPLFKVDQDTNTVTIASDASFNFPVPAVISTKVIEVINILTSARTLLINSGLTQWFNADGSTTFLEMDQATGTTTFKDKLVNFTSSGTRWLNFDGSSGQIQVRDKVTATQFFNVDSSLNTINCLNGGAKWKIDDSVARKTSWRTPGGTTLMDITSSPATLKFYRPAGGNLFTIDQASNTITIDPSVTFNAPGVTPQSPAYMTLTRFNYQFCPINSTTTLGGNFYAIDTLTDKGSTQTAANTFENATIGIRYNGPQSRFELINSTSVGYYRLTGYIELGAGNFVSNELWLTLGSGNTIIYKNRTYGVYNWPEFQAITPGAFDVALNYQFDWVVKLDSTNPYFQIKFKNADAGDTAVFVDSRITITTVK